MKLDNVRIIGLTVVAIGLGAYALAVAANGTLKQAVVNPVLTPIGSVSLDQLAPDAHLAITNANQIPLYPGAQQINEEPYDSKSPWRRIISYQAPADPATVAAFYKKSLLPMGWSVAASNSNQDALYFVGSDIQELIRATVSIEMTTLPSGLTLVGVWSDRTPNASHVPYYPGAQMVTIKDAPIARLKDANAKQRIISYVVDARPEDVQDFYKTTLAQYGWWFSDDPNAGGTDMPGLFFWYKGGTEHNASGGSVSIEARDEWEGHTSVLIRVRGTNISP